MIGRQLSKEVQDAEPVIKQLLLQSGRLTFGELCGNVQADKSAVRQALISMRGAGEVETELVSLQDRSQTQYFLTNWSIYQRKVGFCRKWPFYQHHVTTGANPMLSRKWK